MSEGKTSECSCCVWCSEPGAKKAGVEYPTYRDQTSTVTKRVCIHSACQPKLEAWLWKFAGGPKRGVAGS